MMLIVKNMYAMNTLFDIFMMLAVKNTYADEA